MRRAAPFALAAALLALPMLEWPLRALLLFPALGLLARWSDAPAEDSHAP